MAPNIQNPLLTFFNADLKDTPLENKFNELFTAQNGDWAKIKPMLEQDNIPQETIDKLDFTNGVAAWSNNNLQIVAAIQTDKNINSFQQMALNLNKTDFLAKFQDAAPEGEDKGLFANKLYINLFQLQPTAMVLNMIKDPQVPILNNAIGSNVAAILGNNLNFDIKTQSVNLLLNDPKTFENIPADSQTQVSNQLKTLQRITTLSPVPEVIPVLYNANLHTSYLVTQMPKSQFLANMASLNNANTSIESQVWAQTYNNAQQTRVRNEHVLIAAHEAMKGTGVAMIDRAINGNSTDILVPNNDVANLANAEPQNLMMRVDNNNPPVVPTPDPNLSTLNWDLLFGDADFCECGECTSVYSPAAYFVELLQYLRNNNLDITKPNTGNLGFEGTPLENLFNRRPDLGCLELTCENTNTKLPYIDLSNEVMESYTVHKAEEKKIKPYNVADETSDELLAQPQHTEYQAYCILKSEVFPFTLPYHQPIDSARINLDYLNTSRFEVIDTFRKNNQNEDTVLTELTNECLDRAADAEFLGITKEEYVILTKECFEPKALMEKLNNKTYADSEYFTLIGGKEVWQYYGLGKGGDLSTLKKIKPNFLRPTGIDYVTLVELLKTQFINPYMPVGKSRAIMESLKFSYRYLMNLSPDDRINAIKNPTQWAKKQFPDQQFDEPINPCPVVEEAHCVDAIEIEQWLKCSFDRVGKMIVIESGRECVNGEILSQNLEAEFLPFLVKNCIIYHINQDNLEVPFATIDNSNGEVVFYPNINFKPNFLNSIFKSDTNEICNIIFENEKFRLDIEALPIKDTCNLDTAELKHLNGTDLETEEYDRIHRFIRLWHKLGWSIDEVDKAIVGLSGKQISANQALIDNQPCQDCGEDCGQVDGGCQDCQDNQANEVYLINPELIHQLVAIKKLLVITDLELIKLLCFWSNISTAGDKSLYQKLLLTHNVQGIDKIFKADANGNYLSTAAKISEHIPVLMAALNLSADDIKAIQKDAALTDDLNLSNVSMLYRYRLLSKVLGLRIPAFINILPLFGLDNLQPFEKNIFKDAFATLTFMQRWTKMEDAGFSYQQLNFIIKNTDDDKKPLTPSEKTVLQLAKTLYDGLNAIQDANQDLKADEVVLKINDPIQTQLNIQGKATADFLKAKITLLFDQATSDAILAFLEGTAINKHFMPSGITISKIDPSKEYAKKIKYDTVNGGVSLMGIPSDIEIVAIKALSVQPEWITNIDLAVKKSTKIYNELISTILDASKTDITYLLTPDVLTAPLSIEKAGIPVLDTEGNPTFEPDLRTAPKKRLTFINGFLPYLRDKLTHRFIFDTLGNQTGLDRASTELLTTSILNNPDKVNETLYSVFESIKASSTSVGTTWSGYLIPTVEADYTFIITDATLGVNADTFKISFENAETLSFVEKTDEVREFWTTQTKKLKPGIVYKLTIEGIGQDLKKLKWKTQITNPVVVPTSAFLPGLANENTQKAFTLLKKVGILVSTFSFSADEIDFLNSHKTDFEDLDFNQITLNHWLRLDGYTRLRNSLPAAKINILDFFKWIDDVPTDVQKLSDKTAQISAKIAELTLWKQDRIESLISENHFNSKQLSDFKNETNLLKLQNALKVADKIGVAIDSLFDWAVPTSKFNACRTIADAISNAIRSKYTQTDWEKVVKPLNDKLRDNQRDALIGYLLQQKEIVDFGVNDADGLFEFFLIDVQMDACMETSRIKQGISSIQTFIQRCFLGLEEKEFDKIKGIPNNLLDRDRWNWMSRYRVWEANRKVFLYPENWIESNLRDDKSPFFKELESELLQKDINKQNVTDALKNYLYKVDEVANMEVVGLYIDGEKNANGWTTNAKLHVFSRTRNAPYFFYYRYLELDNMYWYPWEKIQVDIPSYDTNKEVKQQLILEDINCIDNIVTTNIIYLRRHNDVYIEKITIAEKVKIELWDKTGVGIIGFFSLSFSINNPNEILLVNNNYTLIKNGPAYFEIDGGKLHIDDKFTNEEVDSSKNNFNNPKGSFLAYFEKEKTLNGCYLIPVVFLSRLFLFFPQIMKKTKPNPNAGLGSIVELGNRSSTMQDSIPVEYFEVKMGWSEYRNGKWTQKQIGQEGINTPEINILIDLEYFKFIPILYDDKVVINFDFIGDSDGGFDQQSFVFDGNKLKIGSASSVPDTVIDIDNYNKSGNLIKSWQLKNNLNGTNSRGSFIQEILFNDKLNGELNTGLSATPLNFFHPNTHELLGKINTSELKDFFGYNLTGISDLDKPDAFGDDGTSQDGSPLYHELKRPYSIYNWELFFHTPLTLANALSNAQQYEEAMKWYHFVFDPMANPEDVVNIKNKEKRFWQFRPFKEIESKNILEKIFNSLKPNTYDSRVNEWRNKPFMPHVVARNRPVAYMKWVVMKYIDNLMAWADSLYQQDTIESINQATQLYLLAGHILGPKPMMIPKRGKTKVHTYLSLLDKWDAMGDAMAEVDIAIPFSNQTTSPAVIKDKEMVFANVFGFSSARYFCIPNNDKLTKCWEDINRKLIQIRACKDFGGKIRPLDLFEPEIEPGLLVRAAANGLSIASVLNDLYTPMPNYRFYYLLQKALELCSELKSLGGALLSALEKGDNERLSLIRAKHESTMQNMIMEIKKLQVDEAQKSIESLSQNRINPVERMRYYLGLSGLDESLIPSEDAEFNGIPNDIATVDGESEAKLNKFEKEDMEKAELSIIAQSGASVSEALASLLVVFPDFNISTFPLGVGGSSEVTGGNKLSDALKGIAKVAQIASSIFSYQSSQAGKKANFKRSLQERIMQAQTAGFDIKQIDKQVVSQQIRLDIANKEIVNQQKQIDNALEVEEFLKDKFTNEDLYIWMKGNLKTLYHQVYSLAYDMAKKAEKTFHFERPLDTNSYIQSGYFEDGNFGLLAGERLFLDLKKLEIAYHNDRGHDFESTKHISLRNMNPFSLLELRETGKTEFAMPEILFDMDFPGHYNRRIKSVSISIPCITGPYTGVNATLTLLENKLRISKSSGKSYEEILEDYDDRFHTFGIPISSISVSTSQNESGMFELNFKDERYIPFEGSGTISKWRLELPNVRQFDYNTISDVILHVRYTSVSGGEALKNVALKSVNAFQKNADELAEKEGFMSIIDLIHDLPTEWYKSISVPNPDGTITMDLSKIDQFIPFYAVSFLAKKALKAMEVLLVSEVDLTGSDLTDSDLNSNPFSDSVKIGNLNSYKFNNSIPPTKWILKTPNNAKDAKQMFIIVKWMKG